MRSKFLVSAAIAAVGVFGSYVSLAHAAGGKDKDKGAKAKPLELHADDKSIKRQTQWEDRVMGPDSNRSELEKIARARAINEKAEKDKEKQAALEPAPAPRAAPANGKVRNEKAEVSLIVPEKNEPSRAHEISPKLETAAAQAPVPTAKPADDKFIDKLLREDGPTKKRASTTSDRDLENLLAGAKEKPAGRRRGGDDVDALLKSADKGPAMPEPRAQSGGLPEWAKTPEIAPTPPPPAPVAVKTPAPKGPPSGVIQVVQGAAGNAPAIVSPAKPSTTVATSRSGRKGSAAKAPVAWSDPFADKRPVASAQAKKEAASRASAAVDTTWNDPFASEPETRKPVRRGAAAPASAPAPSAAPKKSEPAARPAAWKDPFTKASSEPSRTPVAMRELGKNESSKWEIATRRSSARASASDSHVGGWGVLKKRAR